MQSSAPAQQSIGPKAESDHTDHGDEVEADLEHDPDPTEVTDTVHPEPSVSGEDLDAEADPGCNSGIASRTQLKSKAKRRSKEHKVLIGQKHACV